MLNQQTKTENLQKH